MSAPSPVALASTVQRSISAKITLALLTSFLLVRSVTIGLAEDPADVLPADARVADLQSPAKFFGFEIGSRHLFHHEVVAYWRYLAENSDRVSLIDYGKTHGQRPLMVAAITSPTNQSQLNALTTPRRRLTSGAYRGSLEDELLVMYMGYSVHGDESSAVNAAPLVAYHLASSKSELMNNWLSQGVYLVDPALNPDGIDRFANWANETRGRFPSALGIDREHVQPWPGGRTNYYWFDLNRDWLPLVHPESQGRLQLFHRWKPNVVLDFHEMSGSSSYFFQPGIPARNNPLTPPKNLQLTRVFAQEHASAMDTAGEAYYTEERFDDFYMGKGSTYPDLHGAVGILFEQGSTRGLQLKNDRTDRHFRDTVANQVRTSLSSLRVANRNRRELLRYQTNFYEESLKLGTKSSTSAYVLSGSTSRITAAAGLLTRHQIATYQPSTDLLLNGKTYPRDNTLVIPTAQPEYRFLKSLMDPLQRFRQNIFYDVSTWHLPSAFDLECMLYDSDVPEAWLTQKWRATPRTKIPEQESAATDRLAGIAFSPLELGAPKLAITLQQAGASLRVTTQPFTALTPDESDKLPIGAFVMLRQANHRQFDALFKIASRHAERLAIELASIESGMTPSGPDLGSDTMLQLPKCNPLLVVGEGTRSYSSGVLWHFMDTRLQLPATLIDASKLRRARLSDFSCVVLPEGSYSDWSSNDTEQLQDYVRGGGTVIAVSSANRWLMGEGLINTIASSDSIHPKTLRRSVPFGNAREQRALESIAGAFLNVEVDPTHPLAYGFPDATIPVFRDHSSVFPTTDNPFEVAATYEGVVAGYVSERNRTKLRGTAAVWCQQSGEGKWISLADNPVFRGYVRSSERFFTNALLIGPAFGVPGALAEESEATATNEE